MEGGIASDTRLKVVGVAVHGYRVAVLAQGRAWRMTPTPADMQAALRHTQSAGRVDQLHGWIFHQTGIRLPDRTFTPGHSSPMAFVADAFFHPDRDVAAWACRSGGKTLGASILALLEHTASDGLQGRVLSGSEDQAKNLYKYWHKWCRGPLAWRVAGDVKRTETAVGGGLFQILAASQKKVRGGKVQRLYEDELDEIDYDIDQAAAGMIDSRVGMPGRTVYTSTWHHADGPMARLVDGCPGNGVSLHLWDLWEAIEHCPRERHDDGRGCEQCPLGATCVAAARAFHLDAEWRIGIAADANGLYAIDDAVKAIRKVSRSTWDAEYLCLRPSVEGLVYPEFDARIHRCDNPPAHLTIYRAIDWGLTFACSWIGEDSHGTAYVLDTYQARDGEATLRQSADYILAHPIQNVKATYCDKAGTARNVQSLKSDIDEFTQWGIPCQWTTSARLTEVLYGIKLVRAMLNPAVGPPKLYYVPTDGNKRHFVKAFQSYHNMQQNGVWIDKPKDPQEHEHVCDEIRYFTINRQAPRGITRVRLGAS